MKVLKFGAEWCPGCIIMRPRWQEIEKDNPWLKTEYYDYNDDEEAVKKWGVNDVLPTFIFIDKNEKEILRLQGEIEKKKLINLITEHRDR